MQEDLAGRKGAEMARKLHPKCGTKCASECVARNVHNANGMPGKRHAECIPKPRLKCPSTCRPFDQRVAHPIDRGDRFIIIIIECRAPCNRQPRQRAPRDVCAARGNGVAIMRHPVHGPRVAIRPFDYHDHDNPRARTIANVATVANANANANADPMVNPSNADPIVVTNSVIFNPQKNGGENSPPIHAPMLRDG